MSIGDKMRDAVLSWLKLTPAARQSFTVNEELDFNANAFKNALWYRGNAYELAQFYGQLANHNMNFWGASSSPGLEIRKIHTGLPRNIVNILTDIVLTDYNGIDFDEGSQAQAELWEEIAAENKLDNLLKKATKQALYIGDGAFKIAIDTDVSDHPVIEWVPGHRVEFVYKRGRLYEVIFKTEYDHKSTKYLLKEHYGYGYITNELFKGDTEVGVDAIPETAGLVDVTFDKSVLLATPYIIHESEHWEGRGQSIFDNKIDNFDSLDEAYSQWIEAMRESRPTKYWPESLIPRNPATGGLVSPNPFDNRFIKTAEAMGENAKNEVTLQQPAFPSDDYLGTYITALDLCLQGLVSPSTLGIDVKKLDNAEAQREKEKATLYSRAAIIEALTPTIKALVNITLQAEDILYGRTPSEVDVEVSFGEYANPSFEAVVETVGKAATSGIMSIEAQIDELYGDSKDDEWKAEEVARIKEEKGVVRMGEPSLADPWGVTDDETEEGDI